MSEGFYTKEQPTSKEVPTFDWEVGVVELNKYGENFSPQQGLMVKIDVPPDSSDRQQRGQVIAFCGPTGIDASFLMGANGVINLINRYNKTSLTGPLKSKVFQAVNKAGEEIERRLQLAGKEAEASLALLAVRPPTEDKLQNKIGWIAFKGKLQIVIVRPNRPVERVSQVEPEDKSVHTFPFRIEKGTIVIITTKNSVCLSDSVLTKIGVKNGGLKPDKIAQQISEESKEYFENEPFAAVVVKF